MYEVGSNYYSVVHVHRWVKWYVDPPPRLVSLTEAHAHPTCPTHTRSCWPRQANINTTHISCAEEARR